MYYMRSFQTDVNAMYVILTPRSLSLSLEVSWISDAHRHVGFLGYLRSSMVGKAEIQ